MHVVSEQPVIDGIRYPIRYQQTRIHVADTASLASRRVLNMNSDPGVISAYKMLRTQVLKKMEANQWNSLAVLSAHSNQGSTLTAINLAISIAMEYRHTVLLADFNLRNPVIHRYFDFEPVVGVSDCILHQMPVADALFTPGIESMVVLPGREAVLDSSERLMSPPVKGMVNEIKERYRSRIVLFDLPPVLESDDALAFMDQFDACLLVVQAGVTEKSDLKRIAEILGEKPVLGTVLNDAKM